MKNFLLLFLISITFISCAQETLYNTSKGYAAEGYDVVSYFDNEPKKGDKQFETTYDGVKYKFSTLEHLSTFKADPQKYIPQYGGFCAYAIGASGSKVGINPKTFEVRDGKLYLFYNSLGINTLKKWSEEGAEDLKEKANENWEKIKATQ